MALRDGFDPDDDSRLELYLYALRRFGPTSDTVRLSGEDRGSKLGRKATHVRHLLRELAVFASWEDLRCWPARTTLASSLAVNRSTVSETIDDACSVGWLTVEKQPPGQRQGRSWGKNVYRLILPEHVEDRARQDARARRESRPAEGGMHQGRTGNDGRASRESRGPQADENGSESDKAREYVGKADMARSEKPDEQVGKADMNSLGEHKREHPTEHPRAWEDGEELETVSVPDHFDPGDLGLTDLRALYGRLAPAEHLWAASVLARETTYPVPKAYARLSRFHELEQLPSSRLRELQWRVASRNGRE